MYNISVLNSDEGRGEQERGEEEGRFTSQE